MTLSKLKPQAAIILAAGKGSRMQSSKCKVLHTVLDTPMIVRIIQSVIDARIGKIVVVVGYQADAVIQEVSKHFARTKIYWAIQREQKGTAHAVMCAKDVLNSHGVFNGYVWILSGDTPNMSSQLLTSLNAEIPTCTLLVVGIHQNEPKNYGRLLFDNKKLLCGIREASDCSPKELEIKNVNTGLYRIDASTLFKALRYIEPNNAQNEYYLTDIVTHCHSEGIDIACPILGAEWAYVVQGVNTLEDLAKAEECARLHQPSED